MRVYGIDFTSSPGPRKPITCVVATIESGMLTVDCLVALESFDVFENLLESTGPWIAGMDFPFGQPRQLITALGWPQSWEAYVRRLDAVTLHDFEVLLKGYRQGRLPGHRHHLRTADAHAQARSPMMLYGVPVGRMFLRGAPRLARSSTSVLPCRPGDQDRVVVEAYPALVARRWIGRRSYKSDAPNQQTPVREQARLDILRALISPRLEAVYGFRVLFDEVMAAELLVDQRADELDALLCAIQAAWAYTKRAEGYGIPAWADVREGWIVDPATLAAANATPHLGNHACR